MVSGRGRFRENKMVRVIGARGRARKMYQR